MPVSRQPQRGTHLLRFIINMHYAFQDRENLFMVMDYLSGGDMRFHIANHRRFDEERTSKSPFHSLKTF